jgi:hypothetical protein
MPSYVRLEGTSNQLYDLPLRLHFDMNTRSANKLEGDRYEVFGFADDDVIDQFRAAGMIVEIIKTDTELNDHRIAMNNYFDEHKPGIA